MYGADAVLLIVRILPLDLLKDLLVQCGELGLAVLTEVHDMEDLEKAIECKADIIGINNRDLDTFSIDTSTALNLAVHVPDGCILVSESGINNKNDIIPLKGAGFNAVLVGSALMSSGDPAQKTREIVKAGL